MNKRGVLILVLVGLMLIRLSDAQTTDYTQNINNAFSCLGNLTNSNPSLTLQQATFSFLAGAGNKTKIFNVINSSAYNANNQTCWPSGGCKVKETAQVALALKKQNVDNSKIIDWLKNQTTAPRDLTWYLQVTAEQGTNASCTLGYDGQNFIFDLNSDYSLTAQSGYGNCFSYVSSGNLATRLRISDSCVSKQFTVSCAGSFSNFKTSFLFTESQNLIAFVTSSTRSSESGGLVLMKVNSQCFKKEVSSSGCDYESSLWATAALYDKGESTSSFTPYLRALASQNEKYFPEAFLVYLVNGPSQYLAQVNQLRRNAHWDIAGNTYSAFYDSALGILALGGMGSSTITSGGTLTYLFNTGQQTNEGCWNNNDISDTAFLLYALGVGRNYQNEIVNPTNPPSDTNGTGTPPGPSVNETNTNNGTIQGGELLIPETDCESVNYYCAPTLDDCIIARGEPLSEYNCHSFAEVCCSVQVPFVTSCGEMGGRVCATANGEVCSQVTVQSSDSPICCTGICQTTEPEPQPDFNQTGSEGGGDSNGTSWWLWIAIFIILILLVVIGIIYKDKIRMWWLKRSGKAKNSKMPPAPPGGAPPGLGRPMPPPRFGPPPMRPVILQPRPVQREMPPRLQLRQSAKEKEMEETLQKLRKISDE